MAKTTPTIFDIPTLNAISGRLCDHADGLMSPAIASPATVTDIAADLRLAARIADKLASLRFRIAEIAGKAIEHPEWDNAAIARDLRDALDAAEREND
jgi:hypothetical protein